MKKLSNLIWIQIFESNYRYASQTYYVGAPLDLISTAKNKIKNDIARVKPNL